MYRPFSFSCCWQNCIFLFLLLFCCLFLICWQTSRSWDSSLRLNPFNFNLFSCLIFFTPPLPFFLFTSLPPFPLIFMLKLWMNSVIGGTDSERFGLYCMAYHDNGHRFIRYDSWNWQVMISNKLYTNYIFISLQVNKEYLLIDSFSLLPCLCVSMLLESFIVLIYTTTTGCFSINPPKMNTWEGGGVGSF